MAMGVFTRHALHVLDPRPSADTAETRAALAPAPRREPRRRVWLTRLGVAVLAAGALVAARRLLFREAIVPVTVATVTTGLVEETVTNSKAGTVKSRRRADLTSEIAGRVVATPARAGDHVRAGDVLVRLSDDDARTQLALEQRALHAARASQLQTCAGAAQAARELERARALTSQAIAPASMLDRAETERAAAVAGCEAATAHAQQAEAGVRAAAIAVRRTVLRAPFDGIVAEVRTTVGEWITPAPPGLHLPPVVELIDPAAIYVSAAMDEVDIGKVAIGQRVRVTSDARPGQRFDGRVSRIAPYVVDQVDQGRTFEVEVTLTDPIAAADFVPGASADVEIVLRSRTGVVRIPAHALIQDRAVLVVRHGRLVEQPVDTGLRNWDAVEITKGVAAGDQVVVSLDRADVKAGAAVSVTVEGAR